MSVICLTNAVVYTGITVLESSSVIIEDGCIRDVMSDARFRKWAVPGTAEIIDLNGACVAPGFIDSHIHGIEGVGTEDRTAEAVLAMSDILPKYGVTAFSPTIYPQEKQDFIRSVCAIRDAMGKEKGASILGMHLEGPFISPHKAGVQRVEFLRLPDLELMEEFWEVSEGRIISMTVAPELKGMRELALFCVNKGIVLQAGHSNASYEQMVEGMQAGIIHSTHFFNAMRRLHHRDPGVAGAILIHPEVSCEIIADGFHVHPALIKLLLKEKPVDKIVLVTDALKPAMQTRGTLIANGEEVYLDGCVFHRVKDDVIAGSTLTMMAGVRYLAGEGVPLEDALRMASGSPASVFNLQKERGAILPGKRADIVVFDDDFQVLRCYVEGRQVYKNG